MKRIRLKEVLDVERGVSLPSKYHAESGKYIRLTLGNFHYPNQGFQPDLSKDKIFYSGKVANEYIMSKGDIITPRTEQTEGLLGETARIPADDTYIQGEDILHVIPFENEIDDSFAYYLLPSQLIRMQLGRVAQQTKIRHTTPDRIKKCIAYIPDTLEEQKAIGHLLDTINDIIATNNDMSLQIGNVLAKTYDYWFTQFDFPNEEGKPYRQSGGEMVHNDELDRDIPVGWEVKTLGDLVKLDKEKLPDDTTRPCIDLSVMPEGSIFLNELNTSDAFETNLFKMKEKAILFGSIRPYLHKAGIAPCNGAVAGTVYQFLPINKDDYNFALMALTHPRIFDYAMSRKQGTKMPVIKDDKLLAYKVPYNAEIAKKFNELDIASILANAAMENQRLAQLRDYLLPLLMSGQVVIKPREEDTEKGA